MTCAAHTRSLLVTESRLRPRESHASWSFPARAKSQSPFKPASYLVGDKNRERMCAQHSFVGASSRKFHEFCNTVELEPGWTFTTVTTRETIGDGECDFSITFVERMCAVLNWSLNFWVNHWINHAWFFHDIDVATNLPQVIRIFVYVTWYNTFNWILIIFVSCSHFVVLREYEWDAHSEGYNLSQTTFAEFTCASSSGRKIDEESSPDMTLY